MSTSKLKRQPTCLSFCWLRSPAGHSLHESLSITSARTISWVFTFTPNSICEQEKKKPFYLLLKPAKYQVNQQRAVLLCRPSCPPVCSFEWPRPFPESQRWPQCSDSWCPPHTDRQQAQPDRAWLQAVALLTTEDHCWHHPEPEHNLFSYITWNHTNDNWDNASFSLYRTFPFSEGRSDSLL